MSALFKAMTIRRVSIGVGFVGLLFLTGFAFAHYLWVERADGGTQVFFGEYQEGVKEKSGGRLDEIANPMFQAVDRKGKTRTLKSERRNDHFEVRGVNQDLLAATEANHAVQDLSKYGIGVVKPMFYARTEDPAEGGSAVPLLDLDIVPTGTRNEFRVFFKKQPASEFKVMVYAPNLWMQELKTNQDGLVKIETPWPGGYVLDVVYKEPSPGNFQGTAYEAIRHRATCSLTR